MHTVIAILPALLGLVEPSRQAAPPLEISAARLDADGFQRHTVRCAYQAGETNIRVLLPSRIDATKKYRVLYVLPVEAGNRDRYGDGLREIKRLKLHEKHSLICVAPSFSHLPWYADHPRDASLRQESYLLKVVVPFVEKTYPALAKPDGRLLLGFSKSGWGSFCLLLRNPDIFGKAAAWDAPLMMERPGRYGSGPIFGTQSNFDAYRIDALLKARTAKLRKEKRLVLTGYGNFRAEHESAHRLMQELKIAHTYRDGPQLKHHWNGGWLAEAVELLAAPSNN